MGSVGLNKGGWDTGSIAALTVPCWTGPLRGEHIQSVAQMCEAGRGLHGLLAVFSFAASRRRPKRHSTLKPDREPRELAPLLPAPSVLCITAVIFHITDIHCSFKS